MSVPRVALIGASGHGRWHLRAIDELQRRGRLRLVAVCDVRPVESSPDGPIPADAMVFTDHRALLAEAKPDVVVVCTPPQTHLPIATDVLRAGADLLLEKPPTPTLDEHRQLAAVLAESGRALQVGFQALASPAVAALLAAIRAGELGTVTGVSAVGSWMRDDAYYGRAAWAGKRVLNGYPTGDGALSNPFAHALMNCVAVVAAAGGDARPVRVEAELYRCRDIEVEDTASVRVTPRSGPPYLIAVTLCAEEFYSGDIIVHGSRGRAVLGYKTDHLTLPGDLAPRHLPVVVGPLENLLDHRDDPTVALFAQLDATEPFTAVVEALRSLPAPALIASKYLSEHDDMATRRISVEGVNDAISVAGDRMRLFSESGTAWATPPLTVTVA